MPAVFAELGRAGEPTSPTAPLKPHFSPKAERVIFLYMSGGVSHIDTFDPKPRLAADHGKKVGDSFSVGKGKFVVAPQRTFARGGQSGIEVSDLFPNVRECADDLCVIRSLPHRPWESLRGHAADAHRLVQLRTAEHRLVGELGPRDRQSEPAVLRRARAAPPLRRRPGLG